MVLTKKEVGLQIKKARKVKSEKLNLRYTQAMLANDLDISRGYLGDIENGRTYPNYVLLNKIADICGVSVEFLTTDNQKNKNTHSELISEESYTYGKETHQPNELNHGKGHLYDGNSIEELTEDEINALKTYLALYRQQM